MANLNQYEIKAIKAIVADCDDLDGWGFTRTASMTNAVADEFDGNYQRAGGYIADLIEKGLVEADLACDEVWIAPEVFEEYSC